MITILSEDDLSKVALCEAVIREVVEKGLIAQAQGSAVAEPTTLFNPTPDKDDIIAVVKGSLPDEQMAMVKAVGGFPDNTHLGLATNPGCIMLMETKTGQITGLLPAAWVTTHRTAMVTAIGAVELAREDASIIGCIGTGGIAVEAVRYITMRRKIKQIRLHGRNLKNTEAKAALLSSQIGVDVVPAPDWKTCFEGADILIDGTALSQDTQLYPFNEVPAGCILIVFGAYSAISNLDISGVDRLIMDRWVPDGRGALGPQMRSGKINETNVSAFIGDLLEGNSAGRLSEKDGILFCHRGVAACDLYLARALLEHAQNTGLGTIAHF